METYPQLVELSKKRSEKLSSDGSIVEFGTLRASTATVCTLNSENVINALKDREAGRFDEQQQ